MDKRRPPIGAHDTATAHGGYDFPGFGGKKIHLSYT